jgi:replicative DNA helicase
VLYVTLEMPAREVAERMVARAGVDLGTLQMGGFDRRGKRMSAAEYQLAHDRAQDLANGKGQRMTIVDGRCDVRQIGARMTAAAAVGDPYRYVVIDTLNLLTLPRANSRREGIDAALQELKQAAVQHGVTVHVQAQLGRADDKTTRPPRLQDYKESSGIEQIADVALFVHREKADDGSWLDAGAIILAKARSGPSLGLGRTVWDGATYRYRQAPARHGLGVAG